MKHILMIEDVSTNIKCAAEVLKAKYEVSFVKTGEKALAFLKDTSPDMILLDIHLPDMDGYELLELLKKNEKYADIPVVFLTAESDMESEARGLKMGAMDYIRKPFDPDILMSRVTKVIQMEETKKTLEMIANRDSLTTLWNRRYIEEYIEKGGPGREVGAFLLLDMDNFKQVNDNYGHLMGDNVLVAFARTLQECAGPENRVCRIGGDEFVVFLGNHHSRDKIREIARNLIAAIEYEVNQILNFEAETRLSVSIGIALKPEAGKDFRTLYHCADKALYFVKMNGKRGFHFYDEGNDVIREENQLIDLIQLKKLIQETDAKGAYKVEYDGFKRIYRFVSRCVERSRQNVQMVLLTLDTGEYPADENEAAARTMVAMKQVEAAITGSLRRGDVATRISVCQYVVILMDTTEENGRKVVERILAKCPSEEALHYDIQSVKPPEADGAAAEAEAVKIL